MTRPKLRAGELGKIQIVTLPSGRIQARALMADELGKLRRVKASGDTEDEATRALRTNADLIRNDTGGPTLRSDATIAEACAVFLHDQARSGTVEDSTMETYEASVHNVIVPTCGELLLRDFTVRRCNRILADIRERSSLSAARKARSVLSQVCATGIEYEILTTSGPGRPQAALTAEEDLGPQSRTTADRAAPHARLACHQRKRPTSQR